jgi:hypothetical protein
VMEKKIKFSRRDLNIHIYFQTYSPVTRTTSSRVFTQLAPITGKKIRRLDVKQAFPSEPKLKKTFTSEMRVINLQKLEKHRKSEPKKHPKNSFIII